MRLPNHVDIGGRRYALSCSGRGPIRDGAMILTLRLRRIRRRDRIAGALLTLYAITKAARA